MVENVNKKAAKIIPVVKDLNFETCLKGYGLSKTKRLWFKLDLK